MSIGLLFYFSHRTGLCQQAVTDYMKNWSLSLSHVKIAPREEDLSPALSKLLNTCDIVVVVSGCGEDERPLCAAPIFSTLHVPLDQQGTPRGVLSLSGVTKTGYLIESANQAIALLADVPYEINAMLSVAHFRLESKFELEWRGSQDASIDFETLLNKNELL